MRSKLYLIFATAVLTFQTAYCQLIFPTTLTSTINTCSGVLLDPGGTGEYPLNTDGNLIIYPSSPGQYVQLTFNSFSTESDFDYLKIYDGTSAGANFLGQYSGDLTGTIPGISATNPSGALFLEFNSDYSTTYDGFTITLGCISTIVDYLDVSPQSLNAYTTNPSTGTFQIFSNTTWSVSGLSSWVTLSSVTGTGSAQITISLTGSDVFAIRTNVFTITGGGISVPVGVHQSGLIDMTIDPEDILLPSSAVTSLVNIVADGYSWNMISTIPGWLSFSTVSGSGSQIISITSAINNTGAERSADIVYTYPNGTITGRILQLSPDIHIMPASGITTLSGCSGTLLSPGGTDGYNNYQTSFITLVPDAGKAIKLDFIAFQTESIAYDYIDVYSSNSTLTGAQTYGGQLDPFTIQSSNINGIITIGFYSDGSNTFTGFAAKISCVAPAPATFVPFSGSESITSCDLTVKDDGGDDDYSINSDGILTILPLSSNQAIKLSFSSFNTEENYDTLFIYSGIGTTSDLINTFSGTNLPPDITSASGPLTLRFFSDYDNVRSGFSAHASCVSRAAPALSVSPSQIQAPIAGGNYTLSISSNISWSITPKTGISFAVLSGTGNATVDIVVGDIPEGTNRTSVLTITGEGITQTVTIVQSNSPTNLNTLTGISDFSEDGFKIAPNPANGSFTIDCPWKYASVSILNFLGNHVFESKLHAGINRLDLELPVGIYLVDLSNGDKKLIKKLVVE